MVLLFNIYGFVLLIGIVLFVVFISAIIKEEPKPNNSNEKLGPITLLVHEKPKISMESSKDGEGKDNYSLSIPSSIEEIVLNVTEKDHDISVELESVKRRETYIGQTEPHDILVILKENGVEESQFVTIPSDTEEFNFLIREKDHKISVEVESVKMKEQHQENK